MAVFEQKKQNKVVLDETQRLTCIIETAHNVKDHTEYTLKVQRGPVPESNWRVVKRYSDFSAFDANLRIYGIELPLPPKKVFGKLDREFIAERQQGLQNYLDLVLGNHMLSSSVCLKQFLDPNNFSENLRERALQEISMFFRSEGRWEVVEPAPDIGWRYHKEYFFIKDKVTPKEKYILSWCNFGQDKMLSDSDLELFMKLLPNFQHPNLFPVLFSTSNDTSAISIRAFQERGTLRDLIFKAKPKLQYLKKYGNPKFYTVCQQHEIKLIGRQILETLKYLHDKGLAHGHLHAGNVIVEDGRVSLLEVENCFLGLPSYYRDYFTQFKKIQTLEAVEVYCFGQLLYEMSFGEQLHSATCDTYPMSCSPELRSVMESILTTEACKNGLPSLNDILTHQFFSAMVLPATNKPQVKIPTRLKESLKKAKSSMEKRLREEQKIIKLFRRLSKAQAFHMSDEEKKKRRRTKKKQLETLAEANGQNVVNGVESSNQTSSTDQSSGPPTNEPTDNIAPAPPPPPPAPMMAPPSAPPLNGKATRMAPDSSSNTNRTALLGSIGSFKKSGLKKVETIDKSAPKI